MVCPVVLLWEDQMCLLQELHQAGKVGVSVRPLVDLISESDKETQKEEKAIANVPVLDMARVLQAVVATNHQEGQSGEAVVTVCFNVVMTSDCQRVDVVLSERADERLQGEDMRWRLHTHNITCKWT